MSSSTDLRRPNDIAFRRRAFAAGLGVALLVVCVASLAIGTKGVIVSEIWTAVTSFTDTENQAVVLNLRIPRTALGIVAGIALGVSGALIQAVTRNPLADTQILGINSGAGLFVVAAVAYLGVTDIWSYVWFAFAGAGVSMLVVFGLGSIGRGGATPLRVTLSGVAFGAVLDGISTGIRLLNPRAFDTMRFWDSGSLADRPLSVTFAVLPFVVLGLGLTVAVTRSLNTVALGDDVATALGANVNRTRLYSIAAVTLLAGAATAACGPIGFVGLMVPHVVRWFVGPDQRRILGFTILASPLLVIGADIVGRVVIAPAELPVGVVTAFVGAPMLLWLIRRRTVAAL